MIKHLFDTWDTIKNDLNNRYICLFIDYDGTLTPIVETPDKAVVAQETKDLLNRLSKAPYCRVAIISGRALKDLKSIVGLRDIIYVGNHGLEIEGPKIKFESPVALRYKRVIEHIKDDLQLKLSTTKGAFIEDKGLSLSVHYRLVDEKNIQGFLSIFNEITDPYIVRDKIKISSGKKVYEIRPPVIWDKGRVVLWLLARQQFLLGENKIFPVYIGDDVTDEEAFKVLRNKGISIFVGEPKKSNAQYYLKNTQEVKDFLSRIAQLQ